MKNIIIYFSSRIKYETELDKTKTNALIYINIIGFVLMLIYLFMNFYSGQYKDSIIRKLAVPFILSFIFLIDLYILRKGNFKLAGNLLPSGLVMVFMSFLFAFGSGTHLHFYVAGYYLVLIFMALGALFSDKYFISLNFLIILVFVLLNFFMYHAKLDNEFSHFIRTGLMNFIFTLVGIYLIIFFVNKFNSDAQNISVDASKKTIELSEIQSILDSTSKLSHQLISQANQLDISQKEITEAVNRQASNIEEVSTSIEELTQTIAQGTENANQIAIFTKESYKNLSELKAGFEKYQIATSEINEFTETIINISEKTDILAINASIEASRAGQFSGGFKVIADEIRKLAETSSKSANLVLDLVTNISTSSIEFQNMITSLNQKIDSLAKDTDNLALSLTEEKTTLLYVNRAMEELNKDAQRNAIIAEQVSKTAENLKVNSTEIDSIFDKFQSK
jgi:methyl-accepting chemotaxis protein